MKTASFVAWYLCALGLHVVAQAHVKIMPFGASIVSKCWRGHLGTKLENSGVTDFEFVESLKEGCSGSNNHQAHEGHAGSLATDYAHNNNLTGWLDQNPPDIIIMLLGTNDILHGKKPPGEILAAYDTLLAQMRAKNPSIQLILSSLLPLDPRRWPNAGVQAVKALNAAMVSWAPSRSTAQSPIYFTDTSTNFFAVSDTTDGEHPNNLGNEKVAAKLFGPTRNAICAARRARAVASHSRPRRIADWTR
ncbi:hypothetical protein NX059_012126 [Plenodomus lindquistii]|nr:hypothetical protein NX059_012140 [Plenodomus lindquistii]KAI8930756.1 hypothetical protein NX059_012364 [Plenodomus lindquistii]KAI8931116.1 hypothetical protein NX059_012126 [Plenodomus lindquistii]